MSPPLPCMSLVGAEVVRVRLYHLTVLQVQQASLICRHARHETVGLIQGGTELTDDRRRVQRFTSRDGLPFGGWIVRVSSDLGDQSLRTEAGRFSDRRPDHCPKR